MLFGFFGDFRSSNLGNFLFLFEIKRSESEKKHRSENEKNDGFRKPSEKIKNRRENEMNEEKQQVHRLEVNSKGRNEHETNGSEDRKRRPRPGLLQTEGYERNSRKTVNETVMDDGIEREFHYGRSNREECGIGENGIREEVPERTAKIEKRFGILRRSAFDFYVRNRTVLDTVGQKFDILFDHFTLQYEALFFFTPEGKHSPEKLLVDFRALRFVRLEFADVLEIEEFVRGDFAASGCGA